MEAILHQTSLVYRGLGFTDMVRKKMSQSHGVIGYRTAQHAASGLVPGRRGARHLAGAE